MKPHFYLILFLLSSLSIQLSAQYEDPNSFQRAFHPNRIFSVEVTTTLGIGKASSTFLNFNTQYSLWQRPHQFINLQTGLGLGFMRNDYGKLASLSAPLGILYAYGKKGHFFEGALATRFNIGFSLAEGFQVVPFLTPTIGYRFQIPKEVYFHAQAGLQYHPNLGFAPLIGIGVGYDY